MEKTKVLIIGSGPAGFTAAIYASRAALNPVLYEGIEPGGQLTTTTEIENFPGYPEGIQGTEMMNDLRAQALRLGTDVRTGIITDIDTAARPFVVTVDGEQKIEAETVIICTGASAKYLGLESEKKFRGMGVSACATCDGFFYRKQDVAVVGGGDTACEEATYLASLCRQVYLIVRKPFLRASKAMQERVFNTPNIKVLFEHNTVEVLGDEDGVTGARLRKGDGEEYDIEISGFFLAIGHHPNTELVKGKVKLDEQGYIVVEPGTSKTSVPGIFAEDEAKVKAIYAYVRSHYTYSGHSDKTDWLQGAYVMMTEGQGDCFNYYAVTKLMLDRCGIPNIDVRKVKNYEGDSDHYWSLVSVDGGNTYYHLDTTPRVGDGDDFCLVTDAFLDAYSAANKNCHNRDKSLYPATPAA